MQYPPTTQLVQQPDLRPALCRPNFHLGAAGRRIRWQAQIDRFDFPMLTSLEFFNEHAAVRFGTGVCSLLPVQSEQREKEIKNRRAPENELARVRHAVYFSLDVIMPSRDRSHIVADGCRRILRGSGRTMAARMRARLTRRTASLSERASLVGRLIIRFRTWRFVQRQLARHAPPQALYSRRKLSVTHSDGIHSTRSHVATRNV
jgi:hypothetical protein